MKYLLMSMLIMGSLNGCSPCSRRKPDADKPIDQSFHLKGIGDGGGPYEKTGELSNYSSNGWRSQPLLGMRRSSSTTTILSEGSTSSSDGQDLDSPIIRRLERISAPTTICDRLRVSVAGICTQSRWVWTVPTPEFIRQGSFIDDEQPGLMQRTEVVDTRKRHIPPLIPSPTKKPRIFSSDSIYPYKTSSAGEQMIVIPGNNKPYAVKKSSHTRDGGKN